MAINCLYQFFFDNLRMTHGLYLDKATSDMFISINSIEDFLIVLHTNRPICKIIFPKLQCLRFNYIAPLTLDFSVTNHLLAVLSTNLGLP